MPRLTNDTDAALIPLAEAARRLGMSTRTAYRICDEADSGVATLVAGVRAVRVRAHWKVHRGQLDRFIAGDFADEVVS